MSSDPEWWLYELDRGREAEAHYQRTMEQRETELVAKETSWRDVFSAFCVRHTPLRIDAIDGRRWVGIPLFLYEDICVVELQAALGNGVVLFLRPDALASVSQTDIAIEQNPPGLQGPVQLGCTTFSDALDLCVAMRSVVRVFFPGKNPILGGTIETVGEDFFSLRAHSAKWPILLPFSAITAVVVDAW